LTPLWVQALWPILVFLGGLLWFGGRHRGAVEGVSGQIRELERDHELMASANRSAWDRLDRLDLRLTATETNVTNQGRILDRIEGKLDRLIEARR
jgi:hypothetical protein